MKGPHFFEKRKKEMARQEKLKQKAERKAQRRLEKGKEGGEPGEEDAEFSDIEGVDAEGSAGGGQIEEGVSDDAKTEPRRTPEGGVPGA